MLLFNYQRQSNFSYCIKIMKCLRHTLTAIVGAGLPRSLHLTHLLKPLTETSKAYFNLFVSIHRLSLQKLYRYLLSRRSVRTTHAIHTFSSHGILIKGQKRPVTKRKTAKWRQSIFGKSI